MKSIKKILTLLICLFVGILTVKAYSVGDTFTLSQYDGNGSTYGLLWWTGKEYDHYTYKAVDSDGVSNPIYCMDPGATLPTYYYAKRKLMDPSYSASVQKGDYGILSIIYSENPSNLSEDEFIMAKSIAVRVLINGILGWSNDNSNTNKVNVLKATASAWCQEAKKENSAISCTTYSGTGFLGTSNNPVYEEAKKLVIESLNKMAEFDVAELVSVETEDFVIDDISSGSNSSSLSRSKIAVLKVTINNFDKEKGEFYYLNDSFTSGSTYTISRLGYSKEMPTGESSFTSMPSGNVVPTLASDGSSQITFYLGYKVTYTVDEDESEESEAVNAEISVNCKYNDPNLYSGVILYAQGSYDISGFQRFVLDSKDPIEETFKIKVNVSGSYCDPTVNMPNVCEDGLEDEVDENNNVTYDFREAYVEDSYNIKKCILKGADAQGNSYKLIDNDNASMVSNNPYCSIYCKEDYQITVPYKRYSAPGRYFQIDNVTIKGQQDCYSSQINNEKYTEDIVDAEKALADAFNNWQYYYELVNNSLTDSYVRDVCDKTTCTSHTTPATKTTPATTTCDEGTTTGDYQYEKKIVFTKTYYKVDDQGNWSQESVPSSEYYGYVEENDSGSCGSSCSSSGYTCTFKTPQADYDSKLAGYKSNLTAADTALKEAIQKLKEIIDTYNSCVGSSNTQSVYEKYSDKLQNTAFWDMVYTFEPEIKYSYDEPVPSDPNTPKWIDQVENLGAEVMTTADRKVESEYCKDDDKCEALGSGATVQDIFTEDSIPVNTYCDGSVNANYDCSGTSSTSLSSSNFDMKNYWMCEENDGVYTCNNSKKFNVTNLDYVRRTAVASASYITPRVYYSVSPNATIEITDSETWPENSEQIQGLPVGQNTEVGTYFYILSFANMGKYYSTGTMGRIYSADETSLISYAQASSDKMIEQGNGNYEVVKANSYACSYEVNQDTCEDNEGNTHTIYECEFGEDGQDKDWDSCKARLCPKTTSYCVKEAKSYYVCDKQYVGNGANCTPYDTREAAVAAAEENYNCCPDCIIKKCPDCIITPETPEKTKVNYTFNTISPGNINPYNKEMGYNWNVNSSNVLIAQKAGNTINEIESRANVDIDALSAEEINDIEEYSLKVTMTPAMITWIKSYNSSLTDSGGYINEEDPDGNTALECYDYTLDSYGTRDSNSSCNIGFVESGGTCEEDPCTKDGYTRDANGKCIMAKIFCYSTFIDELTENFADNVDAPNREEAKTSAYSNFQTYTSKYSSNLVGNIVTNDYWTIYDYTSLDVNSDGIPDIGPSWK